MEQKGDGGGGGGSGRSGGWRRRLEGGEIPVEEKGGVAAAGCESLRGDCPKGGYGRRVIDEGKYTREVHRERSRHHVARMAAPTRY